MYLSALCKSRIFRDFSLLGSGRVLTKTLLRWDFIQLFNRQERNGSHRSRNTILLAMKLTSILLLAAFLQVSAKSYTQVVTLNMQNAPLENVLKEIKRQTGYIFFYENGLLQPANPISITVNKSSIEQTLEACFKDQPFEYRIVKTTVFIKRKEVINVSQKEATSIENGDITGRVMNEQGEPLSNANVIIKRTGTGTVTNANGQFTLRNVNNYDLLIISYVGYSPLDLKVGDKTNFLLVMHIATNKLDEAVVQAYGKTSLRLMTGNIGRITQDDIAKQPIMNPLEALQGQVPGVIVTNTTGYATGAIKVEIRGRNTISSDFPSDPLYIIDGVPMTILNLTPVSNYNSGAQGVIQTGIYSPANGQSPMFGLNPSDIESIEVLKDADATAIYGSRGSNGVILITTKKGKAGKTKLEITVNSGINQVPRYYKMLNSKQYVSMRREALANDGLPIDIYNAPDLVVWDTTRYTDWQKYLWGHLGRQTITEANLSGGDSRTTFRIAAGYLRQTEIITYNGANQRGSLDFNISHSSFNQRVKMSFTGTYSLVNTDQILEPSAIVLPPNAPPVFDAKGNLNFSDWSPLNYYLSAFSSFLQPYSSKSNQLNSNMVLSYEIIKGLTLSTSFGYNNVITNQSYTTPIASQDPTTAPKGSVILGSTYIHNVIIEPQAEYNRYLGKGKFSLLIGASVQDAATNAFTVSGSGYLNDALLSSVNNAPIKSGQNGGSEYKYRAAFARINYNFKNKFIINLNARRDGSTRFGPGNQYGNFGSIGGAYIFTEENWFKKHVSFLSFGKIRGSFGTVGGDQIGNYAYLSRWSYTTGLYNNYLPLIPGGHTDSLLQWQVNKKAEISLDFNFLNDRISLKGSWYRNRCNNQLIQFPTPAFTGFLSVTANSPANVQNTGWEFIAGGKIIEREKLTISMRLNVGINRNKLLAYPNLSNSPYAGKLIIGNSLAVRRVLHYTGIDPKTGGYTFEDKNNDGQITFDYTGKASDDSYFINTEPKYDGGFSADFIYKNFALNIFLYFKKQVGPSIYASLDQPGDQTNQPVKVLDHWQKPEDIVANPKFTTITSAYFSNFAYTSDAGICDASFIRVQNLSLSYAFGRQLLKKVGLGNCKIFVQGKNLFLITKYKGIDPEIFSFNSPPLPRTIVAGINFTF